MLLDVPTVGREPSSLVKPRQAVKPAVIQEHPRQAISHVDPEKVVATELAAVLIVGVDTLQNTVVQ